MSESHHRERDVCKQYGLFSSADFLRCERGLEDTASMEAISNALPLTRGIASARALINGAGLADITPLLIQEIGIGLLYGLLGYFMFNQLEIVAKRRGTLETV